MAGQEHTKRAKSFARRHEWNVICDVCGWKYKNWQLKRRWDGLMVCKPDWEPRQILDLIKIPEDKQSIPWARPEATDTFISVTYVAETYTIPSGTFTEDSGRVS